MNKALILLVIVLFAACAFGQEVVLIEESLNVTEDYWGNVLFLGELRNDTSQHLIFVEIEFSLKDHEGKLLDVASGYVNGSVGKSLGMELYTDTHLAPGEVGSFSVHTSTPLSGLGTHDHRVQYSTGAPSGIPGGLTLLSESFAIQEDYSGDARFLGEVQNDTPLHLGFILVTFTTKDAAGKIIDISPSYISGTPFTTSSGIETNTHLAPGGVGVFDISTSIESSLLSTYYYAISFSPLKLVTVFPTTWGGVKNNFRH